MATGELLHKLVAKDVLKKEIIAVASQMFSEYEDELDNSNQLIKEFEKYVADNKIKNDIIEKSCGDNVKDICSKKDVIPKNNSINRFKISNINKREIQSNKKILLKNYQ